MAFKFCLFFQYLSINSRYKIGKIHNTSNPGNNYLQQKFFNNNADLFLSQLNNEEEKELNFQALFAPSSSKVKSGTAKGRLNINSVQKNINLENSNFILSEIINRNNTSNTPKTYLESSFVRSNLQKSSYNESLKESFKETRERIVYDRKLTDYLHKKPNIFKVLTKYTSEINPVIAEIHNIESFNDKNMIETISKRNNLTFLKNKYENSTKKTTKKPQYNNNYFIIKRNEDSKTLQNLNDDHRNFSFDSDNQSLTEANLDNLYKESMSIQKRILEKKNDGVGKRLKQFIKLKSISKYLIF